MLQIQFIFALFAVVALFPEYWIKYLLFSYNAPIPVEYGYALFGFSFVFIVPDTIVLGFLGLICW